LMSRILNVSRSGFYPWHKRAESARERSDRALVVDIKAAHRASRETYGSPRVHRELVAHGHTVGRDRVVRLVLIMLYGASVKGAFVTPPIPSPSPDSAQCPGA
jgi:hypothetical protein